MFSIINVIFFEHRKWFISPKLFRRNIVLNFKKIFPLDTAHPMDIGISILQDLVGQGLHGLKLNHWKIFLIFQPIIFLN